MDRAGIELHNSINVVRGKFRGWAMGIDNRMGNLVKFTRNSVYLRRSTQKDITQMCDISADARPDRAMLSEVFEAAPGLAANRTWLTSVIEDQ